MALWSLMRDLQGYPIAGACAYDGAGESSLAPAEVPLDTITVAGAMGPALGNGELLAAARRTAPFMLKPFR
jgi:hypothetical protein